MSVPPTAGDGAGPLSDLRTGAADVGLRLYDRFADRIHDLALFVARDAGVAAEVTRDVVVMAVAAPPADVDVDELLAWLYAQARSETFDHLAGRGRTPAEDRVVDLPALPADHAPADLAGLVYRATAAFGERDLALLALHLRHNLDGEALGDAMGVSAGAIQVLLPAALARVDEQTRVLLALAAGTACCEDLAALRVAWDGSFSPLVRRRATEHTATCEAEGANVLSPLSLLQGIPLVPAPPSLRDAVEERLQVIGRLAVGVTTSDGVGLAVPDDSLDDTIPPGAASEGDEGDADDATIPPGMGPPPLAAPTTPDDPAGRATTGPDHPDAALRSAERDGDSPPDPRQDPHPPAPPRSRIPLPLAVALGVSVALVVSAGIFRAVADRSDPDQPAGAVAVEPPDVAGTGGADPISRPTPRSGAADLPGSAAPQATIAAGTTPTVQPGMLSVPQGTIIVPADGTAPLRLTNPGGVAVTWEVVSLPPWARADRTGGEVAPGAAVQVALAAADDLPEGDHGGPVLLRWGGAAPGEVEVPAVVAVDRPPELGAIQVGSRTLLAEGCGLDRTEVAVTVTDESEIRQVAVTTAGPQQHTSTEVVLQADPQQPGRYVGILGPFSGAGEVTLEVAAEDRRGNEADADAGRIGVAPCPGGG